jgi:hypothetical protein
MATDVQYNIFRSLYDEEAARYTSLANRAQLYFSIISLYLGALAFKFDDVNKFIKEFQVPRWMFLLVGIFVALALLATIAAIWIRDYEGVCNPEEVIDHFDDVPPSDADFLDDRIAELAVATNRNSEHNNRTGTFLRWAIGFLFLAILMHLAILVKAAPL